MLRRLVPWFDSVACPGRPRADRFGNLDEYREKGLQGRIKRVGVGEREAWVETYGLAESDKLLPPHQPGVLNGSTERFALELNNWRELSVWVELESSD